MSITKETASKIELEIESLITLADTVETRIQAIKMVLKRHLAVRFAGEEVMHYFEKYITGDWKI